jgi:hypothetical protein
VSALHRAFLVSFALVAAVPAVARADVSATFATSVRLVDQAPGRGFAIKVRLEANFADTAGIDAQPILQQLTFNLPDATVNVAGVQTCSAEPIVSISNSYDPCPKKLAVGFGTAETQLRRPQGIDLHGHPPFYAYHLKTALYIGPRTSRGRVLMVIGNGINSPMTIIMRGLLRHVAGGWIYELPIPVVRDPEIGIVKVEGFTMTVGGFNRARPRRWFVEAPRSCPAAGFNFTQVTQFEGVAPLSTTRHIDCELLGV